MKPGVVTDMVVSLDDMKNYLRVNYTDDDSLITYLIGSAEKICMDILRTDDSAALKADENAKAAVMYTVAYLYEHREEADHHALMLTLRSLLCGSRKEASGTIPIDQLAEEVMKEYGVVTNIYPNGKITASIVCAFNAGSDNWKGATAIPHPDSLAISCTFSNKVAAEEYVATVNSYEHTVKAAGSSPARPI